MGVDVSFSFWFVITFCRAVWRKKGITRQNLLGRSSATLSHSATPPAARGLSKGFGNVHKFLSDRVSSLNPSAKPYFMKFRHRAASNCHL